MKVKAMQKQLKLTPLLVTAILLFAGAGNMPSFYYDVLRIFVCAAGIYGIFLEIRRRKKLLVLPFIASIVLFNPIHSLSFSRNTWQIIDLICGILFLYSCYIFRSRKSLPDKSDSSDLSDNRNYKKSSHKRLKIIAVSAVVIIILAAFAGKMAYIGIYGDEKLSGVLDSIPKPVAIIPPIEKGLADWPYWRGPNGDGKSSVTGIIKDWSGGLKKIWEVNYLCQGESNVSWSSVVVSGNRLVVPGRSNDSDFVFCLNSQNGELIWVGSYKVKTGFSHGPGSRATPYIDEDRVYTFGRSGDLVCWSLENGKLLWQKNIADAGGKEPIWGHSSSPLVYQNKVIVQGGGDALVIAYDKMTGDVIWKSMKGEAGYAAVSSMEIDGSTKLLVFHGLGLSCLEPNDGAEAGFVPWKTSYNVNATTPAVSGSTVFITSGYSSGCAAIKVSKTGFETIWKNKVIASQHSDPIIIDGFIYGYSGQSEQNEGWFKCVELETGKEMWRTDKIGWGTTLYVDGHLLCMDIEGNLFLVKPDPKEFIKVTELKNVLGKIEHAAWTIPVIANGKLYIRYMQRLICIDITPQ